MAFMLSARSAPYHKHALGAPWDEWVLLLSVVDLSNLVKRAQRRRSFYRAAGTGSSLSIADHCQAADDEKPSQVVISTLRYLPKALLAAAR